MLFGLQTCILCCQTAPELGLLHLAVEHSQLWEGLPNLGSPELGSDNILSCLCHQVMSVNLEALESKKIWLTCCRAELDWQLYSFISSSALPELMNPTGPELVSFQTSCVICDLEN